MSQHPATQLLIHCCFFLVVILHNYFCTLVLVDQGVLNSFHSLFVVLINYLTPLVFWVYAVFDHKEKIHIKRLLESIFIILLMGLAVVGNVHIWKTLGEMNVGIDKLEAFNVVDDVERRNIYEQHRFYQNYILVTYSGYWCLLWLYFVLHKRNVFHQHWSVYQKLDGLMKEVFWLLGWAVLCVAPRILIELFLFIVLF